MHINNIPMAHITSIKDSLILGYIIPLNYTFNYAIEYSDYYYKMDLFIIWYTYNYD